jgi:heme-degrading monooxygenase HmoA
MLVRIVRMTFDKDKIVDFQASFNTIKEKIINYKGCKLLELYQDRNDECVFFTYSYWESEEDLNHYRNSKLFKEVWSRTKKMFSEKPLAWSVNKMVSLGNKNGAKSL